MTNVTPEDLLEYYYGEMSAEKSKMLQEAIEESWPLKEKLRVLAEAAERLDKSTVSPRRKSVEDIIRYAASHSSATI
jgi:hypothetical protein